MTYVGSDYVQLAYWESATGYGSYKSQLRLVAFSEQYVSTNKSRIYFKWQKSITGGSVYWGDSHTYKVSCGGGSTQWNFALGTQTSTSWTDTSDAYYIDVTHNNDGTKSTSFSCSGYIWWNYVEASGTIELPTIPRASVPTVSPNPLTIGSNGGTLTVTTNRKVSSFTHNMRLDIGTQKYYANGVGASTTFSIPYSILSQFSSSAKELTGTLYCTTYSGSTVIGSTQSVSAKFRIDTSVDHPDIGEVSITDTNSYTSAIEASGSYIRRASDLSVSIPLTVSGSYTELASATVACGNVSQNYVLSGTSQTITFEYDKIDTNGLTITVVDKRGTTVTTTKSWNLVPYIDLTVSGTVRRTTETGNEVAFALTGQCFAGSFGSVTNEITVSYKYKLHSASAYTDGQSWTFTPSGSGETDYSYTNTITGFAYDQQYDLIFTVQDLFTSASTRELVLAKGIPVYGNGEDFFAVYGNIFLHPDRENIDGFWDINSAFESIQKHNAIKNLISFTGTTEAKGGITFTPQEDKSVKCTGTYSAYAWYLVGKAVLDEGTYILSGCPENGSASKYTMRVADSSDTGFGTDMGDGVEFTLTRKTLVYIRIYSYSNDISGKTFYPMIRDKEIADRTFVSPIMDISSLVSANGTNMTVGEKHAFIKGGWLFLYLQVTGNFSSSSFPVGGSKDLTINGIPLPTVPYVNSMTYNGGWGIACRLFSTGTLRFRNVGTSAITTSNVEMIVTMAYPL